MLGGGFLNSRLATRVRQKEGLSYGIASQLQASSLDRTGMFMVPAIYAPQNAAALEAAIKEEIAGAARWLHRRRGQGGQGRLAAVEAGHARAGRLAGRAAEYGLLHQSHAGVGRRAGTDRGRPDASRDQGRARQAHLAGEDQLREGRRLRQSCIYGQIAHC